MADDRTQTDVIDPEVIELAGDGGAPPSTGSDAEPPTGGRPPADAERSTAGAAPIKRLAFVVACPVLAAAIMTGGVFIGVAPRFYAALAGLAGIALGVRASKIDRAGLLYATIIGGIFAIGLLAVVPTGFGNVIDISTLVRKAAVLGDLNQPPVDFLPGWRAILAWVMGALGFAAAWTAIELRRPALGLVITLPVVGIGAISVPESQQLASGLAALVLFVVGLGLLSGTQAAGEDDEPVSLAYEARRAVRALPLVAGVVVLLYFASSSGFLFPPPLYDPAQEAKLPKSVPLSEVEDRVLFTVEADFTGPWKMGSLDVYDGQDWRLPPFSQAKLIEVDETGIVNRELKAAVPATFTIQGLGGAILPTLPNTVGLKAELAAGQTLKFDARNGNIRLTQGQIEPGFSYLVAAAALPKIDDLRKIDDPIPQDIQQFLDMDDAPPPPAVQELLREAPADNRWDTLDFLRTTLLETVVAKGSGSPVSVTPETVQDMLAGSKTGTPFEIVAGQAMLARWAGVPSRIGYGFDGGDEAGEGLLEVRPKHGAAFMEVYFPGFGWLPVIGDPLQAQSSFSDQQQQAAPQVQLSDDVTVRLFVPILVPPESQFFEEVRGFVFRLLPIILGFVALYYLWPLPYKAFRRARRRSWAADHGAGARIVLAYAEWRDLCTDFGYRHYTDTPLMFLERVVPDEEHAELAWLTTRTLWGDLHEDIADDAVLASEELSKSLRRRLAQAHPPTLRVVAALSRLSVRHPYAPELDLIIRGQETGAVIEREEKVLARA